MGAVASQITSLLIVYLTVYLGEDQIKHQSSASLAFVWGIHRRPMNSPHKWPVTRKMFSLDDVIMPMILFIKLHLIVLHIDISASEIKMCNRHGQSAFNVQRVKSWYIIFIDN